MDQTILQDEFIDLWMNKLSEKQRKTRAEAAFRITRVVAEKQIDLLNKIIKKEKIDILRFVYFHETVKSIWEHVDFAFSLGKGKNRRFAFYPARTVMENTFRLEHFTRQKK